MESIATMHIFLSALDDIPDPRAENNLATILRCTVLPEAMAGWSLTSLRGPSIFDRSRTCEAGSAD